MAIGDKASSVKKGILATSAIALVVWLALDTDSLRPSERRIKTALRDGTLGGLESEVEGPFRELLSQVSAQLAIDPPPVLNAPRRRDTVNVYTVPRSPQAIEAFPFWSPGNAVYQVSMDAVYLDLEIVETAFTGVNQGLRFYLMFILLHELGHRALHRNSAGFMDSETPTADTASEKESEADLFALDHLENLARTEVVVAGESFFADAFRSALYDLSQRDAGARFQELLLLGSDAIIDYLLGSGDEYSPFFFDAAHPIMATRMLRLLREVKEKQSLNARANSYFSTRIAQLENVAAMASNLQFEIRTGSSIAAAAWSKDDVILADSRGRLYRVVAPDLPAERKSGYRIVWAKTAFTDAMPEAVEGILILTATKRNRFLAVTERGQVFLSDDGRWVRIGSVVHDEEDILTRTALAADGSGSIGILTTKTLQLLDSNGTGPSADLTEIERRIRRQVNLPEANVFIEISGVYEDAVYLSILAFEGSERVLGVAKVRKSDLAVEQFAPLRVPDPTRLPRLFQDIVTLIGGNEPRHICIESNDRGWYAWLVTSSSAPQLLVERRSAEDALLGHLNDRISVFGRMTFRQPLAADHIALSRGALLHVLDVSNRSVSVPFFMGRGPIPLSHEGGRGVSVTGRAFVVRVIEQ